MNELEPRNFLQPCLLLLLCESPDHGYELAARLRPMHDADGDAGGIYRALRGLERQGLVCSRWQASPIGPARRIYYVTEQGRAALELLVAGLKQTHAALHVFLDRYTRLLAAGTSGRREGGGDDRRAASRGRFGGVRAPGGADGPSV
jgi:poly-beta-hydroxybutyrate-responsive repressor